VNRQGERSEWHTSTDKEVEVAKALNARTNARERDVLATLVHDLRHPLAVVRGYAKLLRLEAGRAATPPSPWLDRGLADIEDASGDMAQIVDEIVELLRARAGEPLQLVRRPADLVELVAQATACARPGATGHRVRLEHAEPSLVGSWDAPRLRRVLQNLLGNALKYSPPDREIILRIVREATADRHWARLEVRDRGRGIPSADLPHVFAPFRRGSNVGPVGGNGLGLASANRIVAAHGGSIAVESVVGQGTTVVVRLPVDVVDGQIDGHAGAAVGSSGIDPGREASERPVQRVSDGAAVNPRGDRARRSARGRVSRGPALGDEQPRREGPSAANGTGRL
jgi:signal transduction histidine kinase